MALEGEYEPSPAQWVRDQVEEFEASDGARGQHPARQPGVADRGDHLAGAKSGKLRKNPVMRVERDGTYVAIASKGGAPENPTWYYNFVDHPEVDLQDGAEKHPYRRPLAEGDERAEWWDSRWPPGRPYAEYQKKTDREIPVFLLERT